MQKLILDLRTTFASACAAIIEQSHSGIYEAYDPDAPDGTRTWFDARDGEWHVGTISGH